MTRGHSRLLVPLLLSSALSVGTSCAATTYQGSHETVPADIAEPTSTVLSGTAAELLPVLADEAAGLSTVMIAGGDDAAVAERLDALWQAVRKEIAASRPELLADFDANVRRSADAVRFNRAADAGKAAENLRALVGAYLD